MRILPTALLAGLGSMALAGVVAAHELPRHTMTVQLPDGTVEQIQYSGNVAPQLRFVPMTPEQAAFWGDDGASAAAASPFALMQQIAAEMDQQAAAMLQQAEALMAAPLVAPGNDTIPIAIQNLPPGVQSYSLVATISPRGICSQSVAVTARGPGQAPQIVSRHSGDCGGPATSIAAPNESLPDQGQPYGAPAAIPLRHHPRLYSARAKEAVPQPGFLQVANLRGY